MKTTAIVAGATTLALLLPGCISVRVPATYDGSRSVSNAQFEEIVVSNQKVRLGMSRDEVLGLFPAEALTLKSTASIDGSVVEEWQSLAIRRDWSNTFERWMYFVDGRLAQMSDNRIAYDAKRDYVERWRASAGQ